MAIAFVSMRHLVMCHGEGDIQSVASKSHGEICGLLCWVHVLAFRAPIQQVL